MTSSKLRRGRIASTTRRDSVRLLKTRRSGFGMAYLMLHRYRAVPGPCVATRGGGSQSGPRTAQRNFAAAARRFANVSSFVERMTSCATSEYTPPR